MTAASANKVTVPGDNRLDELKLGNKTPFWHKIPIIKELRVAVGWQKGMLITGLVLTAFFLLVAIFAPLIAPYSYAQLKGADGVSFPAQAAPSSEHIWGTTAGGYDVFSRVVWGARTAVIAIVVAVLLSIFAGVLLGLVSGYFGGWVDRVLVMIADAVYSFPSLLLAILMAIMISHGQSGLWSGILASGISITVVYIPQYFRTIRAEVIRIKESAYVESARVVGASTWRIMTKHLFKNSTRTLPVILTLNSSEAILTLAGLGFLGFGIDRIDIRLDLEIRRGFAEHKIGKIRGRVLPRRTFNNRLGLPGCRILHAVLLLATFRRLFAHSDLARYCGRPGNHLFRLFFEK